MKLDSICGTLADHRGILGEQCITLRDGHIQGYTEAPRGEALDLRGTPYTILPGIIDLHVHLRGLQQSYKEDEETGTIQAVKAGITLVADMPNTRPRLETREALLEKLDSLAAKSYTDYTVYAALPPQPAGLEELMKAPIAGFKAYPGDYKKLDDERYTGRLTGKLLVVHPEDPMAEEIAEVEDQRARSLVRGCHLEGLAVEEIASTVPGDVRVHITHASCRRTIELAKVHGYSVDVTPHHLYYDYNRSGCLYRVNPPLRDPQERWHLTSLVTAGMVDAIASDHAPHAGWEKSEPLTCSPGIPWLPLWPWLIYRLFVASGLLDIAGFSRLTSMSPARILGLDDRYGELSPGYRANIIVVDPGWRWRFPGFTDSKHRLGVHFMEELVGVPLYTIVGGRIAWDYRRGLLQRAGVVNPFERGNLR